MKQARKGDSWRSEVSPTSFQCACGCKLQLDKGDLQDAVVSLARFGGEPRTWGVDISSRGPQHVASQVKPDPVIGRPCSRCDTMVYLPDYAANMLDERKCFWPLCGDCQSAKKQPAPPARQYWD